MDAHDRRHGTYSGAQQHLRDDEDMCPSCHEAFRRYQRDADNDARMGKTRRVPIEPVTRHLLHLTTSGMTAPAIAARSGVSRATIQDALTKPRKTMRRDNAEALLCITPEPQPRGSVPSTGIFRRIEGLGRLGWSRSAIVREARRINPNWTISEATIGQLMSKRNDVVRPHTAEAIRAVYDSLSMKIPPHNRQTAQVRGRAERKGWYPPLAWDENAIDDPNARPHGYWARSGDEMGQALIDEALVDRVLDGEKKPRRLTNAEAGEIVRRALARGQSTYEIERLYGLKTDRYTRAEGDAA